MQSKNVKVLAIDDNMDNLITLRAVLSDILPDCEVLIALNGLTGIEIARSEDPDVILLDIMMPVIDGFEVCKKIKDDEMLQIIPVLFLTALKTSKEIRLKALEVGAEAFLSKTYDETELVAQILSMSKIKAANILQRHQKEQLAVLVEERTKELIHELKARRRAERVLRDSEEKYRVFFNSTSDFIFLKDQEFRYILANKALREYFNKSEDDILGKTDFELMEQKAAEDIFRTDQEAILGKGIILSQQEILGRSFEITKFSVPLPFERMGVGGYVRDITAKKEAELAIEKSEHRNHMLLDSLPNPAMLISSDRLIYAQNRIAKVMGAEVGKYCWDKFSNCEFIPEEDKRCYMEKGVHPAKDTCCSFCLADRALADNASYSAETWMRGRFWEIWWVPIEKDLYLHYAIDITQRKETEQKLIDNEAKYKSLITQMHQGLALHEIICDQHGNPINYRFLDANESFERLTGLKREEIVGKTVLELMPDTEPFWINEYGKVALTGQPVQLENYSKEIGKYFQVVAYSPKENQFATVVLDITEKKHMQEDISLKGNMLQAITTSTQELLTNPNYNESIPMCLKLLGEATNVDRVFCFKNYMDEDKAIRYTSLEYEWDTEGIENRLGEPRLHKVPFEDCKEFIYQLAEGKEYTNFTKNIEDHKTKISLTLEKICSTLLVPVCVKDYFWGFIGFDELKSERVWSDVEISLLKSFAISISGAIERKNSEDEIEYISNFSNLTSLYNRRKFEEKLLEMQHSDILPISVIMGDVNGLKLANDVYGHKAGDDILKKIAHILKTECGSKAIVARHGGDEFAAILPYVSYTEAWEIIKNIKKRCQQESTDEQILSISFGADTKADNGTDLEECFHVAEERMYTGKLLEGKSARSAIIANFREVMEEKTGETRKHCERIAEMAGIIGEQMNMQSYEIEDLKLLSLLHDIGKTGVSDSILLKPGKLTDIEIKKMQRHCEIGFRIASTMPELVVIAEGVLCHHEQWDGTGYPNGLKGDEIPVMARIVSVLDCFDAITHDRPYRKAMPRSEAIKEIKNKAGTQFDPEICKIFIEKVIGEKWN